MRGKGKDENTAHVVAFSFSNFRRCIRLWVRIFFIRGSLLQDLDLIDKLHLTLWLKETLCVGRGMRYIE